MWFYEHNTKFEKGNQRKVPRIYSWDNLYQGKKYDTRVVLGSMKAKEVCDVVIVLCAFT